MVVADREVHHRANRDCLGAVGAFDHHRAADDRARIEDADLANRQDRRAVERAEDARVGDRKRATREVVDRQLLRATTNRKVGHSLGQAEQVECLRVLDGGHH